MPDVGKKLYQGQPGTSAATVYTAPAGGGVAIRHVRAVNTSQSQASSIRLYDGGTAAANMILPDVPLGPGEHCEEDALFTLAPGVVWAAQQSVSGIITLTIYGVELA